jgi:hypothetical protein
MARKVRNQFGVVSEVPDDYPQDLMAQLGLEEVKEEDGAEEHEPQSQREGRRSRR